MIAPHTNEFLISANGKPLPPEVDAGLEEVVVDQHVGLPAACTVRLHDPTLAATKLASLKLGAPFKVVVKSAGKTITLFLGEISGLEIQRTESGLTFTTVRAFDALHRLQRGRMTKTYQNVTYADVVTQVLGRNKLMKGIVQAAGGVHPHVSQVDESDWQFLQRMAGEIGFVLEARDGKVNFRPPPKPGTDIVTTLLSENVLRMDVSISDDETARLVEVRGWDEQKKVPVIATVPVTSAQVASGVAIKRPTTPPPAQKLRHASTRYSTIDHARAAAKGIAAGVADAVGEVNALLRGDPLLRPGGTLDLRDVGPPYEGRYTITQARHEYRPDEGYEVAVVAGSSRDRTLRGTIGGASAREGGRGVWPGVVTAVKDPKNLGRVRVQFPWLDEQYDSFWARVVHPGAGARGRGVVWLPEVNDEVLVAFAGGELERPYVLGGLYNSKDTFDHVGRFGGTGTVDRRSIRTRTGHLLDLVDARGREAIHLRSGDGRFELTYNGTTGELSITCTGPGGVKINAIGPLELQGGQVTIQSLTTMDLLATGVVTVQGAIIKLN